MHPYFLCIWPVPAMVNSNFISLPAYVRVVSLSSIIRRSSKHEGPSYLFIPLSTNVPSVIFLHLATHELHNWLDHHHDTCESFKCSYCAPNPTELFLSTSSSTMLQQTKLCIAAVAGILSHHLIFIRNEHHIQAPQLFRFFLLLSLLLFIAEARIWALSDSGQAAKASALIVFSYGASLSTSIAIYRVFFHGLRNFPGPIGARVSKFWHVGKLLGGPNFTVLDELHQQYGDFVRTGEHFRPARNQQTTHITNI